MSRMPGPIRKFLALPNEHPWKIVGVAVVVCLVCSIVVAAAAVGLREKQEANKRLEIRRNILEVAGLMQPGADIDELFEQIEPRAVDLRKGAFSKDVDPLAYNQRDAARDPSLSDELSADHDIASIGRRAHFATVYLVKDDAGEVGTVILPVHGYALWSTLYGYLAVRPDGRQVVGLPFYEHAEPPGLGGEIDNPRWRGLWPDRLLFDEEGELRISVVKGAASSGPDGVHQVDGLAGATLTTRGVHNLMRFWAGENGFGPFLRNLRQELADNG